jgi:GNAT superfamily N-acetyltransferase
MSSREVRRTYLELRSPTELRPATEPASPPRITRESPCSVDLYRALYRAVGREYHWRDRNAWTDEQLALYLARPEVVVHVVWQDGEPAGYAELLRHEDGSVEIVYFGLVRAAQGRGLGKWFLTRAVEEAWAMGANRVWLNTCTLDSPVALPNYQARGFVPYRTETYTVDLPDDAAAVSGPAGASG